LVGLCFDLGLLFGCGFVDFVVVVGFVVCVVWYGVGWGEYAGV